MSDYPNSGDPKLETSEAEECVIAAIFIVALLAALVFISPCG